MSDIKKRVEKLKTGLIAKDKALQKIQPFENCGEVVVSGKTTLDFHPDKDGHFVMKNQGNDYEMTESAFMKLIRLCGITENYGRKIPKQLLFPHISYWLNDGGKTLKAFTRPNGGIPSIAGFAKEDAYFYPISRFMEQMDKVNEGYYLEGLDDVTWRNSTFGIVFPEFEFDVPDKVEKGDWVYGGIKVRTSLLGEFPTRISAFLLTLVCMNGMISANEIYTYNRKQGFDGQDAFIVDGLQMALGALSQEVERVGALKQLAVDHEHVTNYINHVFDQMGVNQKSRVAVLEKVIQKNPQNLYELMNAVTSVAHTIENRGEAYHIQSVGGYIVQHAETCKACYRPL
jgi:hypothetical protein